MKPLNLLRGGRIFKRGKHVLTSAPHFAAAAAVFVCFGADPAIADCRITGGSGNITGPNVIVCDGNGGPIGNFSAAGGIDRITVNDGAVANQISGGRDRDTIAVNGGTVNTIDGGAGNDNDSFILNGGIVGDVRAGGGDNTFRLVDTVVTGSINGGAGTDTLTVAPTADTVFATNIANIEQLIISTDSYVVTFEDGASFDFVRTHAPDENETSNVIFNGDLATPELGVQRAANGSGAVASLRRLRTNLTLNGTVDDGSGGATRITGTDGVNTVVVGATGVVNATALLDLGNDVLDVAGTLDTGAGRFQLGAGSDRLIIRDNANISGTIDGGGGADSVEVDVVATASSTLDEAVNFETLTKNGEGSLTLTGDNGFSGGVALNNGTLNVTGTLDNGSGGQTTVTGSANETTLSVGDSGTLLAEGTLGDGADVLDVAGTLDTGAGNLTLGLGDDTFRIQDGTAVTGVVDGGLGTDTIDADIATSASDAVLTQASNFETLTKNGAGALNLTGMFDFSTVNVNEGLLNVTGDLDDINVATVSSGATLTADGAVTFTDNADTFTVAGTVDGGSQIRLLDGDDNFNILGGTDVSAVVDGGAGDDTVSADIAATQSADLVQVTNFEALTKTGAGTLNVTGPGASEFSTVNANAGVLNVTGEISGISDATVSSGATLTAGGNITFTGGDDSFTVAGTVDGASTINLGAGNDTFTFQDGASVSAVVDGDAGDDTLTADIANAATLAQVNNFETLTKRGAGTLNVTGDSDFSTVEVDAGVLNVTGEISGISDATVLSGATLTAGGNITFTGGDDSFTVAGTVDGASTINLGAGNDTFTFQDGASVSAVVDGDAGDDTLTADIANAATLAQVNNFETLTKRGAGTLNVTGDSDFSTVEVDAGVLNVTGEISGISDATVSSGATLTAGGNITFTGGDDSFTVAGTVDGASTINLGAGNDTFTFQDGASVSAVVDGDAGDDTLTADIANAATLAQVNNFETLTKRGAGTLNVTGDSDFSTVEVDAGVLNVTGEISGISDATVSSGATLTAGGNITFTGGDDSFTVAGTVDGASTINLGAGNDTFTFQDGASVSAVVDGDAGDDTLTADIANAATLTQVNNFETLTKRGAGTLNVTGDSDFSTVEVDAGVLNITGGLIDVDLAEVSSGATLDVGGGITFADNANTTLTVAGTLNNGAGSQTALTGSSGANTVNVTGTLFATGDLGDGADTLDVSGTLDTGAGELTLGLGDDIFSITDGTIVRGTVDGGAGADTFNTNINGVATVGAVKGFETLTKTGAGTLNVTGPDASDFATVNVNAGTLDVASGGAISGVNTASVGTGAAIDLDGGFTFTTGNDSFDVAGTLTGSGTFNLDAGNDTLTLRDGADLSGLTTAIDGGADTDTVVVDAAGDLTLDGSNLTDFEELQKNNTGELTLTGNQGYSAGITLNGGELTVAGTLNNGAGSQTALTGSSGANTVNVTGTLFATGDLGDGADTLNVSGILDTGADDLTLGLGDDTFSITDGTVVRGTVDGGAGADTFNTNINGVATVGAVKGFETLTKAGIGTLNVTGPDASDFSTVNVNAGTLDVVSGGLSGINAATVMSGATLTAGGNITFTGGNDRLTVAGTVDGASTINLGAGNDTFTFQDGASVSAVVDGGVGTDTLTADIAAAATLAQATNFETLTKTGAGTLSVTGTSDFATVEVDEGTLDVASGGAISGVNTASVGTGAAIDLDGGFTFTTGNDSFDVAGRLTGSGAFDLDAGNDTLTLRDGADLSGLTTAIDGGADTDTVVVDAIGDLTLDGSNLTDFEELQKNNTGELTLTGNQGYSAGITLNGGELTVAGTLNNGAGSQTALTGSSGANTVNVTGTLFATGDLGDGADTLNVSGILDTGADDLTLGLGDDTFSITDGTVVRGTVDGGAGADTFNTNINGVATVGAVKGFETLTKAGIGTLNVTGPDASDFATVNVNAGTLDVASGGAISGVNTASVGTDAEIDLDGGFSFTTGDDSFDVAGTLTGSGTFNLDAGNDTLTLRDGADLSGLTTAIDGGADTDTVVVDAAGDLTLDDSNLTDFEALQKDNTGELTLTGNQGYSEGIALNGGELTVAGTLGTAEVSAEDGTTLTVEGTLNNGAGSQTEFTDFNGANTVNVTGTLFATGDLGDGADTLDVSGTLDTGAGELTLGLGDDTFSITDGTVVRGTVDGGVGADTFNTNINGVATVGAVEGFETLTKTGTGTLNVAGASDFSTVNVNAGLLNATGGLSGINAATVLSGATLTAGGNITFTGGDDSFTVAGTVDGASTINLGGGNDTFTFQDGASVSAVVDGDAGDDTLTADIANAATLAQVNNFETLTKRGAGTLSVTGTSDFATVEVDEGTLDVETGGAISGVNAASVGTGATIDLDDGFTFTTGNDGFDVAGRLTGSGTFDLDTGNDTLTLRDGADLSGLTTAIDGGADTDTVIVDATGDLTLDESNLTNFEALQKNNSGELTLTGDQEYSEGIALNGGELTVDTGGNVSTSGVALADSTILRVRGILQNGTTTLTGSPGSNTVIVDATGTLMAMGDLGAGTDLLDVAGSLDTGLGSLSLGLDDDTFTIYDSTMLTGLIDGGEGVDTVNANIDIASDVNTTANFEVLNKNGAGVLNLSGSATTGFTTVNVNNGILNSSNAFEIGGDLNVLAEGTFRNQALGATTLSILGDIRNAGAIDLQDGAAGDRIVVSGDYTGGGTLLLDVNLADGTADTLDITGAVSSGTTTIFVNDLTPGTANTSDIVIVDVAGTTSAGDFQLAGGELVSGAFTYVLNLIGSQWVLQLEILPQNFLYEAYPRNLQALNQLSSHRERGQNRSWLFKDELDSRPTGVWMRIGGSVNDLSPSFSTFEQNSGAEIDYDINTAKYEVGLDTRLADSAAGQLVGGAWLFYGNSSLSGASALANGDIDTDAFGVGASLTWYSNSKFYADAQFQYAAFDSDLSTEADTLTSNNKGSGRAWSLEVGRPFSLNNSVSITPELQYVYSDVDFDTFTTDSGETVSLQDGSSSEVKLGATFEYNSGLGQTQSNQTVNRFFVSTNVYHQFDTTTEVDSTGTSLVNEVRPWRGELGIGGSREWIGKNGARSALFGELSVGSEFGSSFSSGRSLSGNLGFRVEF